MQAREMPRVHPGKTAWGRDPVQACIQRNRNCADIRETTARAVSRLTV